MIGVLNPVKLLDFFLQSHLAHQFAGARAEIFGMKTIGSGSCHEDYGEGGTNIAD
jgi:hypothetical protein